MSAILSNLSEDRPIDRAVAREAAHWLACMYGGEASAEERVACERWRLAHPEHERAWQRAQRLNEKFGVVPAPVGVQALGRKVRVDRRQAVKTLLLLMTVAPVGYVTYRTTPWHELTADYRTAKGEHREIELADGSRIHLGTATSVDVTFDGSQRLLRLHAGEILVTTGADTNAGSYRPFTVQTKHGRIRALGTRFVVRKDEEDVRTRVSVLEHAVEIRPQSSDSTPMIVRAGQQTSFDAVSIADSQTADAHVTDWTRGVLVVNSVRLIDFATELNRYRKGLLRCDDAVADLRITGAFQLNNTDNILNALPDTLPVEVLYRTRYWVTLVQPAATPKS